MYSLSESFALRRFRDSNEGIRDPGQVVRLSGDYALANSSFLVLILKPVNRPSSKKSIPSRNVGKTTDRPQKKAPPKQAPKKKEKDQRLHALQFLTSAANLQGCPKDKLPEVAIVGRSNAGKSSLINGLANSRVANVSSKPGKTRLLNFFQYPKYRLVDMPGYGFAARGGAEQRDWQRMIEPYLAERPNLVGLLVVMDIRRDWSDDEEDLLNWIGPRMLPSAVILTKADKLSRSEVLNRVRLIQKQSNIESVLVTSALKKDGYQELEDFVFKTWIKK